MSVIRAFYFIFSNSKVSRFFGISILISFIEPGICPCFEMMHRHQSKPQAAGGLNFKYGGKTEMGLGFAIVQPKDAARTVLMVSRIDVSKQHRDALSSMTAHKLENFIWELKMSLVLAPALYQILPPQGIPRSIQLSLEISFDELTEGRLNNALSSITKSAVVIILLFNKKFELETKGDNKNGD